MTYISKNMRYLRRLSRLSQQAFAEKVGLNRGNIASYEKGTAEPSIANVLKITKFFNVDLVDFIDTDLSEAIQKEKVELEVNDEKVKFIKESLLEIVDENKFISLDGEITTTQILIRQSIDHHSIIEGFKQYHRFKMEKFDDSDIPNELKTTIIDYERLIEVSESLIEINRELIKKLLTDKKVIRHNASKDINVN